MAVVVAAGAGSVRDIFYGIGRVHINLFRQGPVVHHLVRLEYSASLSRTLCTVGVWHSLVHLPVTVPPRRWQ